VNPVKLLSGVFLLVPTYLWAAPQLKIVTEHLPPFQIDNAEGVSGFATDVVRATMDLAKIEFSIEAMSWSRAYNLAQRDANTCIYSISKGAQREPHFQWIGEISYSLTSIYSLKKRHDIQINTLEDAKKYTIAVTKDDITHHFLLSNGFKEGQQLYVIENVYSMLNILKGRKNIDLIIVNDTILKYRAKESGVDFDELKKQIDLPELPLDFYLACSNKMDKTLVTHLKASLEQLKTSGKFQQIQQNWTLKL
jgi:polar amino acid transport system substrate-binding protein